MRLSICYKGHYADIAPFIGISAYPRKRTFGSIPSMSALCRQATYALQQFAALSITSEARASSATPTPEMRN